MNKTLRSLAAVAMLAALPVASALAADYVQAPGSKLAFATKYDGEVFAGTFPGFAATLSFDPVHLDASRLDVIIPLAGATTGNDDRDSTLKTGDFFDVGKFAQAHYSASKFRDLGAGKYAADGTLELKGVSKPVTLTFTWTPGAQPVLFGRASIKRLDFGIGTGDWADTKSIPADVAVSTHVVFKAK